MRRFVLVRREDVSGCSGTGVVAEGVEFSDGRVATRWRCQPYSSGTYDSVRDLITVHGHHGRTSVQWIDPSPSSGSADGAAPNEVSP